MLDIYDLYFISHLDQMNRQFVHDLLYSRFLWLFYLLLCCGGGGVWLGGVRPEAILKNGNSGTPGVTTLLTFLQLYFADLAIEMQGFTKRMIILQANHDHD